MSWQGDQEQEPPQPGGGGRRRRRDSPPEDPHLASQHPGGSGRRGSGEFARPAEYVQYAEEQAASYDDAVGYGQSSSYGEYPQYSQPQPQYPQSPSYGDAVSYEQQPTGYAGYAQPSYLRPETDPYGAQAVPPQSFSPQGAPPSYQPISPAAPPNLNSSGFYPPAQAVPAQAAPQPAAPAAPVEPEIPGQPYAEPSRFVTRRAEEDAEAERPATADRDSDVSDWLHFVESRADQRAERARRLRFRLIALAVVVAVAGAGAGLWYFLRGGDVVTASQTTVLFQIRDGQGNAVGNVVLVAAKNEVGGKKDPAAKGAALLIPAEMTVESSGLDSQPFGGAMPTYVPAGKDALTTLLGIDIDGVWGMDEFTFASLIDNLIGVTVDVDVPVTDANGKVLIQPGKAQQLTGAKAVVFATYHAKDEPPARQLARFGAVVNGMLAKIPASPATTTAILNALGVVPDPALPNDRLAAILTALGGEQQGKRFTLDSLPLRADGSALIDLQAASPVVARALGGATHEKDNGGLTRVALSDGTGRADTVSSRAMATSKLLNGGYTPLDTGTQQAAPTSYVEVPNEGAKTLGKQVAVTLGLPDSAVKVVPFDTTLAEAVVVLGQDWTAIGQVPADQPLVPGPSDSGPAAAGTTAPAASKPAARPSKPSATKTR